MVHPFLTNEDMTTDSGGITVSPGMEGMPSFNMSVQRLKVAVLSLDLPCSGSVTYSGEMLTTGKSHGKKPDIFSLKDDTDVKKVHI